MTLYILSLAIDCVRSLPEYVLRINRNWFLCILVLRQLLIAIIYALK